MTHSRRQRPRSRRGLLAPLALAVALAVLVRLTCSAGTGAEDADGDATAAGTGTRPAEPGRSRGRARAAIAPAPAVETGPAAPGGPSVDADGWPAADIVVRHPDGRPAARAVVYLHLAGASCENLDAVARRSTDDDGHVRFPAPHAGRYDVGAFRGNGWAFSTLLQDVEFPATKPVVIELPRLARLEVRADGELPKAWVTVAPADAERVRAFPGGGESKYAQIETRPLSRYVDVPRGVPLRVRTNDGIVADPPVVTAPGTVTLRPDGRITVPVDLVFVGPEPPDHVYAVRLTVEAPAAQQPGPHVLDYGTLPHQFPITRRLVLRAPPGPVELRLSMRGQGPVTRSVFAAPLADGEAHRVEVPVASWTLSEWFRLRVTCAEGTRPTRVQAAIGPHRVPLDLGEVRSFTLEEAVGATAADERGAALVAAPQVPTLGGTLDLVLVPGADVVVRSEAPREGLDAAWPFTAELADGRPFMDREGRAVARTPAAGTIGRFPPGDHELVFRLAGREVGRRGVRVVAGPPIEVDAPELAPRTR